MSSKAVEVAFIASEGYTFQKRNRSVTVASYHKGSKAVLQAIAQAYKEHQEKNSYWIHSNRQWRWCANPECPNAFFAFGWQVGVRRGVTCSRYCAGKLFGANSRRKDERRAMLLIDTWLRNRKRGDRPSHAYFLRACPAHYWCIEPPMGSISMGTCRNCGATKPFKNFMPLGSWNNSIPKTSRARKKTLNPKDVKEAKLPRGGA